MGSNLPVPDGNRLSILDGSNLPVPDGNRLSILDGSCFCAGVMSYN